MFHTVPITPRISANRRNGSPRASAALRVARLGGANEHSDSESAHHVFTYANAFHQMIERIGDAEA